MKNAIKRVGIALRRPSKQGGIVKK